MQTKGATLRRRNRGTGRDSAPSDANPHQRCDVPVGVVFRVHQDSLSKVPFLFCPKNFNLAIPQQTTGGNEKFIDCIVEVQPPPTPPPMSRGAAAARLVSNHYSDTNLAAGSHLDLFSLSTLVSSTDTPIRGGLTAPATESYAAAPHVLYTHPSGGWICRLMCFSEREASHANGAISVHQSQMAKCAMISEAAKGKAVAVVLSNYGEVKERYGLSHLKLSCVHQYLSRSDLFMISELLRDRILYQGEELTVFGFRLLVSDMLFRVTDKEEQPAPEPSSASWGKSTTLSGAKSHLSRVYCGVVTAQTKVNFDSRSPVHYIVVELSREMWDTTIDGRVTLSWAFRKFLWQLLSREMPKRKVYPLLRILFTGRLRKKFSINGLRDVMHMLEVPSEEREADVVSEAELHCDAFINRVLKEIQESSVGKNLSAAALTPKDIFVLSKNSNTLETLSTVLERCGLHYVDRRLSATGHAVTVVSAGKCLYRATNNLVQVITARLHDVGLETVHVVCIGRPPLHATPLLEYRAADHTLRSQYHLHSEMQDPTQVFYETPVWLSVLFFFPKLEGSTTEVPFVLLTKEEWLRQYQGSAFRTQTEWNRKVLRERGPLTKTFLPCAYINGQQVLLSGLGLPYHSLSHGVVYPAVAQSILTDATRAPLQANGDLKGTGEGPATAATNSGGVLQSTWYVLHSAKSNLHLPQYHLGEEGPHEVHHRSPLPQKERHDPTQPAAITKQKTAQLPDAAPCGLNVVDSDVRNGQLVLELTIQEELLPGVRWSPTILENGEDWRKFLSCFTGSDGRLVNTAVPGRFADPRAEADTVADVEDTTGAATNPLHGGDFFVSSLRPVDIFCHSHSGISSDGKTLIIPVHSNQSTFQAPEVISLAVEPFMFASVAHPPAGEDADEMEEDFTARHSTILTAAPSREDLSLTPRNRDVRVMERFAGVSATARVITVGYIQLRSSLLFALKAVDPLCGADPSSEELHAQSSENISTSVVFKRRWLFKHPDLHDEPPHVTTWTALCTCNMLPIYGMRSAYPRDAFYTIPPHQYTIMDHATSRGQLSEFIIQRLQQQYQLVVDSASEEATFPLVWPREEPTANARVELSAGHQVHLLKIGETLQTLSVTRLLHRGMYSNGQVVHMLSYKYCLWNYLEDCFSPRRVYLEAQVGESNSYSWEELDRWLQSRPDAFIPRGPQLYLRPREIALVLVPLDPSKPPSFQSFLQFISYRFSALLSVRGKVEWKPDSRTLLYREKKDDTQPDDSLMNVILSHDSTQVLERRTTVDPRTGAVVSYEVPVEERMMSVDITLPPRYHPHCCYPLKVDWLVCSASIVSDWYGSFIANANRHGFKAIPVPSDYQSLKSELLSVEWSVVCRQEKNAPTARQKLCEVLLSDETDYYVDHLSLHAEVAMRLVHISGLCYVVLPRLTESGVIAQWHQNSAVATGTLEQQKLLSRFSTLVGRTIGDLL